MVWDWLYLDRVVPYTPSVQFMDMYLILKAFTGLKPDTDVLMRHTGV